MMTVKLLQKDYVFLASCLVPIGDQIGMSQQELADMLRTKTRRFTEEDIRRKFGTGPTAPSTPLDSTWRSVLSRLRALFNDTGDMISVSSTRVDTELSHSKQQ